MNTLGLTFWSLLVLFAVGVVVGIPVLAFAGRL